MSSFCASRFTSYWRTALRVQHKSWLKLLVEFSGKVGHIVVGEIKVER